MKTAALIALLSVLRAIESDSGVTSRNQLQITPVCVADVNRIVRLDECPQARTYTMRDADDVRFSCEMALVYLNYYGRRYESITGSQPNAQVYARIWNGGPDGWKKPSTLPYWRKVRHLLNRPASGQRRVR